MEEVINTNTPEVEGGEQTGEVKTTSTESGDRLDAISDPEVLRKEAKQYRASYHRVKEERDTLKDVPVTSKQYVTKDELQRANTQEAQKRVPDEVRANWTALADYVPAKYKNATTPDDIAKAMTAAHVAYKAEHPEKETNPGADLQTDTGAMGGSQRTVSSEPVNDGWGTHSGPDTWFK